MSSGKLKQLKKQSSSQSNTLFQEVFNDNVDKEQTIKERTIFSDVIKNISRVNHVLQELIHNYEKIQNIYKTKSFETDYSSDSEIDNLFEGVSQRSKKGKNNGTKNEIMLTTKKDFPGTQMFISEEDEIEHITEKSNYLTDEDNQRKPLIESLQAPEPYNASDDKSVEEITEKLFEPHKVTHRDHKHSDEIKVPDNVFFDNVQKAYESEDKTSKSERVKKHKKNRDHKEKKKRDNDEAPSTNNSSAKNVLQVIQSESFHQEIWKEIADKKPIKLSNEEHAPYETKREMRQPDIQFQTYSGKPKTALVIVTKREENKKKSSFEEETSDSIAEDEKAINKELFKTSVLRQAYGDACSKLVVRKCFKACKVVLKSVCSVHKCKGKFKEKFKAFAKSGCLEEFVNKNNGKINSAYRDNEPKDKFIDFTRGGIEACYPFLAPKEYLPLPEPLNPSLRNTSHPTDSSQLNILRDSYERACQKASTSKCNKACKFSYTSACATYKCKKIQKKSFKKLCKRQCKVAYKNGKTKKGSSDSSNSDSSNSDSDYSESDEGNSDESGSD